MKCSYNTEVENRVTHRFEFEEPGRFFAYLRIDEGKEEDAHLQFRDVHTGTSMMVRVNDFPAFLGFLINVRNERTKLPIKGQPS